MARTISTERLDVLRSSVQSCGMTQAHERTATLSEMVAEEIRALMARRKVSGRELASQLAVSPSWISYRLSGKQPIDVNDLLRIANALGVGVHDLLDMDVRTTTQTDRPRDNRPAARPGASHPVGVGRTAYVARRRHGKRD
jgi:transcriptional regulator with XRE-family HTH domain